MTAPAMAEKLGVSVDRREAQELEKDVAPEAVLDKISKENEASRD